MNSPKNNFECQILQNVHILYYEQTYYTKITITIIYFHHENLLLFSYLILFLYSYLLYFVTFSTFLRNIINVERKVNILGTTNIYILIVMTYYLFNCYILYFLLFHDFKYLV